MKSVAAVVFAAFIAITALPSSAVADTTPNSTITQIKVVERSDAKHRLFHGAIWLELDKETKNYRWGGSHCGNKSLSELNISLLYAAFRSKHSVMLDYQLSKYKKHVYRCITGFTVARQ